MGLRSQQQKENKDNNTNHMLYSFKEICVVEGAWL